MKSVLYIAEPYGYQVWLYRKRKDFQKEYRRLTKTDFRLRECADGICSHLDDKSGSSLFLIGWFGKHRVSTLAHECSHAAFRICHEAGVRLKWDNNEAHAYLVSTMMDTFLKEGK